MRLKPFVIDCSVTMGWCFEDQADAYTDTALNALKKTVAIAPALWAYEVTNVLLVAERRRKISSADSIRFLELLKELPIELVDDKEFKIQESFLSLGRDFNLSAYDAAYLHLAMSQGLPLATRDTSLRTACKKSGVALY